MINKAKSIRLNRNRIKSPSPDKRNSNLVQSTCSPVEQIEKFLAISKHQAKLKQEANFNKFVPTNEKSQPAAPTLTYDKQQAYKQRIKQLEYDLQKQRSYTEQFDELAQKNNKLKDQMVFLLQELEQRYQNRQQTQYDKYQQPNPKQYRLPTLETSVDHNSSTNSPTNLKRMQFSPSAQQSAVLPSSLNYLHQYIQNLENQVQQIKSQTSQIQSQIRKSVKKDMHEMEQRLMSYIFGLEQRFNETNFRNQDIFRKIQNMRDSRINIEETAKKETVGNFHVFDSTGKSRKQSDYDSNFFKLSASDGRREDSVVSVMNKDMVLDPTRSMMGTTQEQKTAKKQQQIYQNMNNYQPKQCQKCFEYLSIIETQAERIKTLQQQLLAEKTTSQSRQILTKSKPVQKPESLVASSLTSSLPLPMPSISIPVPDVPQNRQEMPPNFLSQIQQEIESSREQNRSFNISEKWNNPHRDSHINIVVDSSGQSSFAVHDNQADAHPINTDDLKISGKSHKSNELYKLEKVKDQLVNIMQQIQQLVHECESESKADSSGRVGELVKKIDQQATYIGELEQEISRLQLQIQINKTKREQMQKFIRLQVKQQQQAQSPYFRPIKHPIDCIDHKGTKTKIDYIMKSIKMFERDRIEGNAHDQDRPKVEPDFKIDRNTKVEQGQSRAVQKYGDDSDKFIRIHTL